jgi:hypothetical protein
LLLLGIYHGENPLTSKVNEALGTKKNFQLSKGIKMGLKEMDETLDLPIFEK